MPDNEVPEELDPRLDQFREYFAKAAEWLERFWGTDPPCPVCTNTEWFIAPLVESPIRPLEMGAVLQGQAVPLVPVICKTCGHVMWFHAITMGLSSPGTLPSQTADVPK